MGTYPIMRFLQISARYAVTAISASLSFDKAQTISSPGLGAHHSPCQPLARHLVVEPSSIRGLAADCPLLQRLGFNLAPSTRFFLLSSPSHLPLFHGYVVVRIALGVPRNSMGYFFEHLPVNATYLQITYPSSMLWIANCS